MCKEFASVCILALPCAVMIHVWGRHLRDSLQSGSNKNKYFIEDLRFSILHYDCGLD